MENQNPFGSSALVRREDPGALVEVEQQRAIAETQAAMIIAKKFQRNQAEAADRILTACTRPMLAESALYQYARGGTDITGPSIRLAEAMAQNWGNIQFGIRELEQRNGESTVEAFAWDIETNVKQVKVFQVAHRRHTKKGSYALEDPRDIYEMVANQGARRLRACILGVIPGDVVEAAVKQCEVTMNTKAEVTPERIKSLIEKFAEYKVTKVQIEKRIQRKVESITPALMVNLGKIYNSLKDGMSAATDWFEASDTVETAALTEKLKANATKPEPEKPAAGTQEAPVETKTAAPAGEGGKGNLPEPVKETATSQGPQPPAEQPKAAAAKWDPYKNPLQARYGADKMNVIKAECDARRINVAGLKPAEAHALLIDAAKAEEEQLPEPGAETPEQAEALKTDWDENGPQRFAKGADIHF